MYPVHLNPLIRRQVNNILGSLPCIYLTPPLNYLDFVNLMKRAYLVVTDSGGLQEEAPSLGKPVLVLRKVTERPEAVKAGTAKVIGTDKEKVYREIKRLLENKKEYLRMARAVNPYGDGRASKRIKETILFYFRRKRKRPLPYTYSKVG